MTAKKQKNRVRLIKTKIYFIKNKKSTAVKIGISRNVEFRFTTLQTDNYEELIFIGSIFGGIITEKEIHKKLEKYKIRGEWFKFNKTVQKEINILLENEIEKRKVRKCKICGFSLSESNIKETCRHHDYKGW